MVSQEKNSQPAKSHLGVVQRAIIHAQADACIITSSVNLYYLCGFIFDGYLYIRPEGKPILFVKRPADIENAVYIRKPEQIPDILREHNLPMPKRLLLETDALSYNAAVRLQAALGMPEVVNVSGNMREMRSIKSDDELAQIRKSAQMQTDVYRQIPSLYRAGMTDVEFQAEVEHLMRRNGSLGIFRAFGGNMEIFMGSVLAGDNAQEASPYDFSMGGKGLSAYLPIGAAGVKLQEGMAIMFNMAGNYTPYQSDMSRTFVVGKAAEIAYRAHNLSIEMNRWVQENAKPSFACADIYDYSLKTAHENGLQDYFMGTKQQAKFVGHGLGLEINEPPVFTPRSRETLQAGMAFAYEPKFVLPGIGPVGVENTFIVHETGVEKITLCEEKLITL